MSTLTRDDVIKIFPPSWLTNDANLRLNCRIWTFNNGHLSPPDDKNKVETKEDKAYETYHKGFSAPIDEWPKVKHEILNKMQKYPKVYLTSCWLDKHSQCFGVNFVYKKQ